jgi:hypothetical protein
LDEVYRFRHVGTGKFLAIAKTENRLDLTLSSTANSLDTLFCFKSEMTTKKQSKYGEEIDDDFIKKNSMRSHQRVMIMSYLDKKYLQLLEELDDLDIENFKTKTNSVTDPHDDNSERLTVINHTF